MRAWSPPRRPGWLLAVFRKPCRSHREGVVEPSPEAQLTDAAKRSQVLSEVPLKKPTVIGFPSFFIALCVCLASRKNLEQTVTLSSSLRPKEEGDG